MKLLPFQEEINKELKAKLSNGSSTLNASEQGLGKTIMTLFLLKDLGLEGKHVRIYCPASVVSVWQREIANFCNAQRMPYIAVNAGVNFEFNKQLSFELGEVKEARFTIMSYNRLSGCAKDKDKSKFLEFSNLPDYLVFDESHSLKNEKAKRTENGLKLAKAVEMRKFGKVIFLSGTPIPNRVKDAYTVYSFIAPTLPMMKDFWSFARRFCGLHKDRNGFYNYDGASNLRELASIFKEHIGVRRTKAQVGLQLPDKIYQTIPIRVSASLLKELNKASKVFDLDSTEEEALFKIAESPHIATARREMGLAKVPAAIEFISGMLESVEKIIVFYEHHDVAIAIEEAIRKSGSKVVRIGGDVAMEKRGDIVKAFQEGDANVFLGQIKAAGTGITLTAASHEVFVEFPWNPGDLLQCEDRAHRIGQKNCVNIYNLVCEASLEEKILSLLRSKKYNQAKALGDK